MGIYVASMYLTKLQATLFFSYCPKAFNSGVAVPYFDVSGHNVHVPYDAKPVTVSRYALPVFHE
jgi:hypothetical protein